MASMRKLNQRTLRWRRYTEKTGLMQEWGSEGYRTLRGYDRATAARYREWERRNPNWRDSTRDPWCEPEVKIVGGRREAWIVIAGIGGYVCAEPDAEQPDGICGMPVESEPCDIHHPGAVE